MAHNSPSNSPFLPSWHLLFLHLLNFFQHMFLFVFFHERLAKWSATVVPPYLQYHPNMFHITQAFFHNTLHIMLTIMPGAPCLWAFCIIFATIWIEIISCVFFLPHLKHLNSPPKSSHRSVLWFLPSLFFPQIAKILLDVDMRRVINWCIHIIPQVSDGQSLGLNHCSSVKRQLLPSPASTAFSSPSITDCSPSVMAFFCFSGRCALTYFMSKSKFFSGHSNKNSHIFTYISASFYLVPQTTIYSPQSIQDAKTGTMDEPKNLKTPSYKPITMLSWPCFHLWLRQHGTMKNTPRLFCLVILQLHHCPTKIRIFPGDAFHRTINKKMIAKAFYPSVPRPRTSPKYKRDSIARCTPTFSHFEDTTPALFSTSNVRWVISFLFHPFLPNFVSWFCLLSPLLTLKYCVLFRTVGFATFAFVAVRPTHVIQPCLRPRSGDDPWLGLRGTPCCPIVDNFSSQSRQRRKKLVKTKSAGSVLQMTEKNGLDSKKNILCKKQNDKESKKEWSLRKAAAAATEWRDQWWWRNTRRKQFQLTAAAMQRLRTHWTWIVVQAAATEGPRTSWKWQQRHYNGQEQGERAPLWSRS